MSQRLIPTGERSGLLTRIATTESVLLRVPMKGWPRFLGLESVIRRFLDHLLEQHAQIDVGR